MWLQALSLRWDGTTPDVQNVDDFCISSEMVEK